MSIEECFKIGYVAKTHGLKGEVTVVFENDFEIDELTSLFAEMNGSLVPYFIETLSDRGDKSFIKFESIDSLTAAENIKGKSLYLPKSSRAKLKRGEFYDDEVVGFSVEDESLGYLGLVKEIQSQGLNRILIIQGNKEILAPINSPFVVSVNKTKRLIKLRLPEGYLDI
ncbi:MAG TPA: 16S rRNA processing protein RimM [Cytophagales bacterium]|jgi:16S rRNA processing protein RimM|nr:16S rRNA processing protein RimM [Cytophagales bacterium]